MNDITGKPPSGDDIKQAISAVNIALVKSIIDVKPIELAVQLPNILRCLQELAKRS